MATTPGRWQLGVLPFALATLVGIASSCSADAPSGTIPANNGGVDSMSDLAFELVAFVPWMEHGLEDELIYSSMRGPGGSPIVLGRLPPLVLLGPDGTLWLGRGTAVVRIRDAQSPEAFALAAAGIETLATMAPTLDAGMLLFGREGSDNVLARLSDSETVVWRKLDVPLPQDGFDHAQLLVDLDGSAYLYARGISEGLVVQVNLDDGATSVIVEFAESPPKNLWVREGRLFWTTYSEGVRAWVSRDIEAGERKVVEGQGHFQSSLGKVCASLPGGGALLEVSAGHLIWMGQDGDETNSLMLAGIVRADKGIAVGLREEDTIAIAQWSDGQTAGSVRVDSPSPSASLIYVDQDGYHLMDPQGVTAADSGTVATVDFDGGLEVEPCFNVSDLRLQRLGVVATMGAVVERDGSVLLPGADPEGAYVVRIKGMPSER